MMVCVDTGLHVSRFVQCVFIGIISAKEIEKFELFAQVGVKISERKLHTGRPFRFQRGPCCLQTKSRGKIQNRNE